MLANVAIFSRISQRKKNAAVDFSGRHPAEKPVKYVTLLFVLAKEIIGNQGLKNLLEGSVERGRVSHAQLFVAPQGVGVLPVAVAYAARVLGIEPEKALNHPDLHFAFPVNTTKEVKKSPVSDDFLDLWRRFATDSPYGELADWYAALEIENKQGLIGKEEAENIARKLSLKSFSGGYKAMIVWHAEKMNATAANKLLKLIEEPAENTLIILTTDDPSSILPTIASRTQAVYFRRIADRDIADELARRTNLPLQKAEQIAFAAQGDMNRALKMAKEGGQTGVFAELFVRFVRSAFMAKKKPAELGNLLVWADQVAALPREQQKRFLQYCLEVFREALMRHYGIDALIHPQDTAQGFNFESFSGYVHGRNIAGIYRELDQARYHVERNANSRIVFFSTAVNLTRHLHAKPI